MNNNLLTRTLAITALCFGIGGAAAQEIKYPKKPDDRPSLSFQQSLLGRLWQQSGVCGHGPPLSAAIVNLLDSKPSHYHKKVNIDLRDAAFKGKAKLQNSAIGAEASEVWRIPFYVEEMLLDRLESIGFRVTNADTSSFKKKRDDVYIANKKLSSLIKKARRSSARKATLPVVSMKDVSENNEPVDFVLILANRKLIHSKLADYTDPDLDSYGLFTIAYKSMDGDIGKIAAAYSSITIQLFVANPEILNSMRSVNNGAWIKRQGDLQAGYMGEIGLKTQIPLPKNAFNVESLNQLTPHQHQDLLLALGKGIGAEIAKFPFHDLAGPVAPCG